MAAALRPVAVDASEVVQVGEDPALETMRDVPAADSLTEELVEFWPAF